MSHILRPEDCIGHTPLIALDRFSNKNARLLAKYEARNPGGSVKDRAALYMINQAERDGLLKPGGTIIESTSGNTGIGLAAVGIARGYRVIITLPDSMSVERRRLLAAYGAELVLTPGKEGVAGALKKAEELLNEIPNSFMPDQFSNSANALSHYETTGPEIWNDTDGDVACFVAGIGTGGTITGIGRYLKEQNPAVRIIGVEPASAPFFTQGIGGPHGLQGIGAGFVPKVLDRSVVDEILTVTEEQAYAAARDLAKTEGFLTGISGGAALYAAKELAKRPALAEKNIVVLLPDGGEKYLSTPLYASEE